MTPAEKARADADDTMGPSSESLPALRARAERPRDRSDARHTLGFWLTPRGNALREELSAAEAELARREAAR